MIPEQIKLLFNDYFKSLGIDRETGIERIDDWNGMQVYRTYRLPGTPVINACFGHSPYGLFDGTTYRLSTLQELCAIRQRENAKEFREEDD